ncbi:MAG: hypothetical protein KGM24_07965, partial [Elusimicrobia bacterium]|nr:hypothetical protein [Elusimicrobiota bacterium]
MRDRPARPSRTLLLLAASLLLGGLRDPRLAAGGEAAVFGLLWLERPPLGPAAAWLPWLGLALLSTLASAEPLAGAPVLARWAAALGFFSLAAAWTAEERADWLKALLAVCAVLAAAALATFGDQMRGLIPPNHNYTAFALSAGAAAGAAW